MASCPTGLHPSPLRAHGFDSREHGVASSRVHGAHQKAARIVGKLQQLVHLYSGQPYVRYRWRSNFLHVQGKGEEERQNRSRSSQGAQDIHVCMYGHTYSKTMDQPGKGCQSCSWSGEQGKLIFPCPRSRLLRIWSRDTGSQSRPASAYSSPYSG